MKLRTSIPGMILTPPVKHLTGREFFKGDVGIIQQVGDFFKSLGNKVTRPNFGDVIIDEKGVQNDVAHGLGRAKAITFAAVPEVIAQGKQIDYQPNWKGRGYDSYVFAAPVAIKGEKTYVTAIVTQDSANKFYLHEVLDGNGNLIYMNKKESGSLAESPVHGQDFGKPDSSELSPTTFKAGLAAMDGITGGQLPTTPSIPQGQTGVNSQYMQQGPENAPNDLNGRIQEYNRRYKKGLADEAAKLIENSDNWKEKATGFQYARETMERNFADIIKNPGEAKAIIDKYITPIHRSEAQSTRMKNDLRQRVKALDIGTQNKYQAAYTEADGTSVTGKVSESALVQLYGEGRIGEMGIRLSGANFDKIDRAVKEFRAIYNELLDAANESLVRNGYKPVEYRKDYFPHFTDIKPDTLLGKILQKVGIDVVGNAELPTSIAGLTETFRPGKPFVGSFKQRLTEATVYDALRGFDRYLEGVSDVIHHTDNIQRLRALESAIRYNYSDEGTKAEIRDNPTLTDEQKRQLLDEVHARNTSKFPYL